LDQEQLPTTLSGGRKREETFRRATEGDPSPGWTEQLMSCDQKDKLELKHIHVQDCLRKLEYCDEVLYFL